MRRAFVNGRVLLEDGLQPATVITDGGIIEAVFPGPAAAGRVAETVDLEGALLLPGFIDVQVNGGAGVLFNDAPTVEGIRAIGRAHRHYGTTGFLPTLISDEPEVIRRAITAVDAAIEAGAPGVIGLHVEGPCLSVERAGVHDPGVFRELDDALVELFSRVRRGRLLVTLAPEAAPVALISELTRRGCIVSLGHTNASYAEAQAALAHGATGFTHLFNAMSPLASRAPGVVGAALASQDAYCGIIVDGRHVDPAVLRIALRTRPADRFMLVTDAMPCVGTGASAFQLRGETVHVEGATCVDSAGTLAGTALDMASAIRNAINLLGVPLPLAVRMASEFPARFLGLGSSRGRIAPGLAADLVVANEQIEVLNTWIDGEVNQ